MPYFPQRLPSALVSLSQPTTIAPPVVSHPCHRSLVTDPPSPLSLVSNPRSPSLPLYSNAVASHKPPPPLLDTVRTATAIIPDRRRRHQPCLHLHPLRYTPLSSLSLTLTDSFSLSAADAAAAFPRPDDASTQHLPLPDPLPTSGPTAQIRHNPHPPTTVSSSHPSPPVSSSTDSSRRLLPQRAPPPHSSSGPDLQRPSPKASLPFSTSYPLPSARRQHRDPSSSFPLSHKYTNNSNDAVALHRGHPPLRAADSTTDLPAPFITLVDLQLVAAFPFLSSFLHDRSIADATNAVARSSPSHAPPLFLTHSRLLEGDPR